MGVTKKLTSRRGCWSLRHQMYWLFICRGFCSTLILVKMINWTSTLSSLLCWTWNLTVIMKLWNVSTETTNHQMIRKKSKFRFKRKQRTRITKNLSMMIAMSTSLWAWMSTQAQLTQATTGVISTQLEVWRRKMRMTLLGPRLTRSPGWNSMTAP